MRVSIIGSGAAGLALACWLRHRDYEVSCIEHGVPTYAALEATPAACLRLFAALGLQDIPEKVCRPTEGFGGGTFLLYQRSTLQAALRRHAAKLGVDFHPSASLGPRDGDPTAWWVDASGRAAVLSRPQHRHRIRVADVYTIASTGHGRAQFEAAGQGWAYDLDDGVQRTIGLVAGRRPRADRLPMAWAERLGIAPVEAQLVTRRAAHAQWSEQAIQGQRLSVGDAAFAHEPLAGQGLRFALGSALAAGATLRTLIERPAQGHAARAYYASYVADERQRHLAHLRDILIGNSASTDQSIAPPDAVTAPANPPSHGVAMHAHDLIRFAGRWVRVPSMTDGFIDIEFALQLPNWRSTRWAGGVDLAVLREIDTQTLTVAEAQHRLQARGLSAAAAQALLAWSMEQNLLAHWPC